MQHASANPAVVNAFNLRAWIFLPVFGIACLASLAYVYSRPAVYLSSARLQIESPQVSTRLQTAPPPGQLRQDAKAEDPPNLLTAAQALTSRRLLEELVQRLNASDPGAMGSVVALQGMLSAEPVPGTNVIELRAEGGERELLPRILGAWMDAYRQSAVDGYDQTSAAALKEMRGAVQELRQNLAAKRQELEGFRSKFDIVSLEREENQAMAQLKGLNTALNEARSSEVKAEARFNAMRDNVAAGKMLVRPEDKAMIASLEQRAVELRDKMKDAENDYGPQYLAIDPKYRALRANLSRLEQQIEQERQRSAQQALQVAEEELASAQQTTVRLQQELAVRKRGGQEFTARFAEHTALVNELRRLEESYNSSSERLAQLEIERKRAGPKVNVLSQPSTPDRALRPDYTRDALLGIAGSGVLGLFAVWFFEFFKRSGVPQPAPVMQPIIQIAITPGAMAEALTSAVDAHTPRLTQTVTRLPRELSGPEVDALLAAASPDSRPAIAALLSGRPPPTGTQGATLSGAELEGLIARAANDAGLENPAEVTADVLRQTYLAYLARQGSR